MASLHSWNFPRSVTGTRLLVDFGVGQSMSEQECLQESGLHLEDLRNPRHVVTAEQELRVIRNLLRKLQGQIPHLGIEVGLRYHYTTFGILGFNLATCASARQALETVVSKYFNLTFAFTTFRVNESDTETEVIIDASDVPHDVRRFVIERDVAALIAVQRELSADRESARRVCFAFDEGQQAGHYAQALGVATVFNQRHNRVCFDRQRLLAPLAQANELIRCSTDEQCGQLRTQYRNGISVAAKVKERLSENLELDMEQCARAMFMTTRTLRRQLDEEATSFKLIKDRLRLELARQYLVEQSLSVENTALRLGYQSSSAFVAAFRRMTQQTPLEFRKHQQADTLEK
ncbi:AraC-like DNA-binding protein [Herbaspirillum rubrisubalbicans]|uniref:AraC family transcriptional regulator n=1 Tax=Herbaspirillum rubrisubalbicans TaxID=80842 RepID=UPI0020A14FB9|nr:AraC family transcriptional regulator [Herbaspirillum rubrisubalbicans]MCP1574496.1 AraC-like DNA-binding protein [Herbaspirillum rubrisubalbicans]